MGDEQILHTIDPVDGTTPKTPLDMLHAMLSDLFEELSNQKSLGGEMISTCVSTNPAEQPSIRLQLRLMITPLDEQGNPMVTHEFEGKDIDMGLHDLTHIPGPGTGH